MTWSIWAPWLDGIKRDLEVQFLTTSSRSSGRISGITWRIWLFKSSAVSASFLSEENPQAITETHAAKSYPLVSLYTGGTIGPCLFQNNAIQNVTFNGERYISTITNFFIPPWH